MGDAGRGELTCRARNCPTSGTYARGLCRKHYATAERLGLFRPCERCERQLGALSTDVDVAHDDRTWFATLTQAELAAWTKGYLDAIEHRHDVAHIDRLLAGLIG